MASPSTSRPYRQVARAAATDRLQQRIVEVFFELLLTQRLDEITLDAVAAGADTTRQTIIRMFGGKERLLTAAWQLAFTRVISTRTLPPRATVLQIADVLVRDYDSTGDMIIRFLSQQDRYPELAPLLEQGRSGHRTWITDAFAAYLKVHEREQREALIDQLIAVTDVYIWKLFRRDFKRDSSAVANTIAVLLDKVLVGNNP